MKCNVATYSSNVSNVATNEERFLDLREVIEKKLAASQDNFHKSIISYFNEIKWKRKQNQTMSS